VLDYLLKGSVGSASVVQTLKGDGISSHIVLMSGVGDPHQRAIQLGLKHSIQKPFAPEALQALLGAIKP
jgi:hypothetical protein